VLSLDGRVVLVTGAAGGIGSAVARTVVANGGIAVVHDRDERAVISLGNELGSAATALSSDLSDPHAVHQLWLDAVAARGAVDVLVNNAGMVSSLPIEADLEEWVDSWNRVMAVNLVATSILCKVAVLAYTARPPGGIIINVASVTAFRGAQVDNWHYGATKGGILALTRTIASHYGRSGVTAFAVAPGFVVTPMSEGSLERLGYQTVADSTGLGELAQPQDVANVIAFLATGLARHASGTTIDVNSAAYVH
jgi:NAD(P)-dependent dehydrogenase (short-subunit alcohol dehydrogenase family)